MVLSHRFALSRTRAIPLKVIDMPAQLSLEMFAQKQLLKTHDLTCSIQLEPYRSVHRDLDHAS